MRRVLAGIVIAIAASALIAQDALRSAQEKLFRRQAQASTKAELVEEVVRLKSEAIDYSEREEALRAKLEEVWAMVPIQKKLALHDRELYLDRLSVGAEGVLSYPKSVINYRELNQAGAFPVADLIGNRECLIKAYGRYVWVSGVDVSYVVDGQSVVLKMP